MVLSKGTASFPVKCVSAKGCSPGENYILVQFDNHGAPTICKGPLEIGWPTGLNWVWEEADAQKV